jgi:hypothetical protein
MLMIDIQQSFTFVRLQVNLDGGVAPRVVDVVGVDALDAHFQSVGLDLIKCI